MEVETIKAVEDIKEEGVVEATSTQTIEVDEVVAIKVAEAEKIKIDTVELKLIEGANGYALSPDLSDTHMHNLIAAFEELRSTLAIFFLIFLSSHHT